ncbi:D-2-hydroxyacid dehydrogenase [Alkaliphilus crotonatoxidans]
MCKILVNDAIEKKSLEEIAQIGIELTLHHYEREELMEKIKEFDGIIIRSATRIDKDIIDAALKTGKLKLIVRAGVGLDNVDVDYAVSNGLIVKNTPDSSKISVAELAIGHMITLARSLHHTNRTMQEGKWLKKQYQGIEVEGKTLGIIGFGRIGQTTAQKAAALGMKVIYNDRMRSPNHQGEFEYVTKEELLQRSDFISLHVPFNKEEGPVLAKREFDMMKDGVYLINCARGGVICEKTLLEALDSGKVAGAALDVFEEEPVKNGAIYRHEKISLSPHIGASTEEAQERIGEEIVKIVSSFYKEEWLNGNCETLSSC